MSGDVGMDAEAIKKLREAVMIVNIGPALLIGRKQGMCLKDPRVLQLSKAGEGGLSVANLQKLAFCGDELSLGHYLFCHKVDDEGLVTAYLNKVIEDKTGIEIVNQMPPPPPPNLIPINRGKVR